MPEATDRKPRTKTAGELDAYAKESLERKIFFKNWLAIEDERSRQISEEGFDHRHDDYHDKGELKKAARCYEMNNPIHWPWPDTKPKLTACKKRRLVIAGALYLAEAERLRREADFVALKAARCALFIGD